jgi:hypothetical protein
LLSQNAPRRLRAALNRARAVRLRLEGRRFSEIAQALGVSKSRAFQFITEAMAAARADAVSGVVELLAQDLAEVRDMLKAALPAALRGSASAAEDVFNLLARRDRLRGPSPDDQHGGDNPPAIAAGGPDDTQPAPAAPPATAFPSTRPAKNILP